jgi:hypothetical protein
MRNFTKRSAAIAAATVIAVGGGTAAFAYASGWFQGGGEAAAYSSTIQPVTATITIPDANRLFPGATVPLVGNVVNPNDYKVKVTGVSVTGVKSTKGGANNGDCVTSTADLAATFTGPFDLNSGQTAANWNIGSLSMGGNANVACAGSRITATLTFTGELTS